MAYDGYLVQEADGTSRFTLEDGSGSLVLETAAVVAAAAATGKPAGRLKRNQQAEAAIAAFRRQLDDEDAIATLLTIL